MAEKGNICVVIIGYLLAVLFSIFGLLFGIILYFSKQDDSYYAKHAKYIIILSAAMILIGVVLASMMGLATLPL